MSKLSDFKTDVLYANEERKRVLIDESIPFWIEAIALDTNGQYGPKWMLTCMVTADAGGDGTRFRLSLSATQSHNDIFEPASETVSTVNPLGPVCLVEVPTKAGRTFRTLEDAE